MPTNLLNRPETKHEISPEFVDLMLHRGLVIKVGTGNARIALETSMGTDILDPVPAIEEPVVSDLIAEVVEYPVLPPMY